MRSKDLYKEYRERIKEAHKHNNKKLLEMYIAHILKQIKKDKWTYRKDDNNMHLLVQLEEHLREIKVTDKKNQERENVENAIVIDLSGSAATEQRSINDIDDIEQEPVDIDLLTTNQSLIEDNESYNVDLRTHQVAEYTSGKGGRVVQPDRNVGEGQAQRDVIELPVTFLEAKTNIPEELLDDAALSQNLPRTFSDTKTFPLPEKKFEIDPGEDHYKNFLTITQKTDIRDLIKELKDFRRGL
jgi:hypothetical protein